VLHQFRGHFLSPKNTRRDGERDRRLQPVRCVDLPDFTRRTIVKSMNQIIQIPRGNLAALPSIKLCVELHEGLRYLAVMRDAGPLANQSLQSL
jgi:hypothetical protein